MLFTRQRLLLTLLGALGQTRSGTEFQRLLFLYTKECEEAPSYEFVPYRFGGFSFTSYADKRRLIASGLLEDDEKQWTLTEAGLAAVRQQPYAVRGVADFARRRTDSHGDALIAEVYRSHPYYATRSEIVDRVLPDEEGRARVLTARPRSLGPGLVTLGYEGKSLERYLNQLLRGSVTLLCDVRRNPLSRKYGFSKGTLSKTYEGLGIRYEHLPNLGIASDKRRKLETQADYDALFDLYERDSLPHQKGALETIRGWIDQGYRVALTCYEEKTSMCHRHCVAEALERLAGSGLAAVHL